MDSNIIIALLPLLPVGIRMLDGDVTDIVEAQSLSFRPQYIDIYLASWGPEDDGATLDGPGPLTRLALQNGIQTVREKNEREKSLCVKEEEKRLFGCVCLFTSVSHLRLYIYFKGLSFSPYQCVNIINKLITSVCFPN